MVGAVDAIDGWAAIGGVTKVVSCLQPDVIWLARMLSIVRMVLRAIGGIRQKAVEVGTIRAPFDNGPVLVLHQDDKNGLHLEQTAGDHARVTPNWQGCRRHRVCAVSLVRHLAYAELII